MSIRIMIVDNHQIVREGISMLLERHNGMEIVAQATNGRQAVQMAVVSRPDVVLMDITMPELNGIDATAQILKQNPSTRILALSAHSNKRFIVDILKAGACGYILKDCVVDELIRAIETVSLGQRYLCSKATEIVVEDYLTGGKAQDAGSSKIQKLTAKEREMLQLLVEGKSTKQIALKLGLSVKTIDARRRDIMDKLEIDNIAEMTKFAIRQGIISLD